MALRRIIVVITAPPIGYKTHKFAFRTYIEAQYIAVNQIRRYKTHMFISGNQIKAARALSGMEQTDLAKRADVSVNTVRNLEATGSEPAAGRIDTLNKIITALKAAGVLFVPENGEGPGVRLKKQASE